MTRIDFYLLKDSSAGISAEQKIGVACRLAEKAFNQGHQVYLYTPDVDVTRKLDDLLWTFSPNSFVPHGTYEGDDSIETRVWIGHHPPPHGADDVLISLSADVPEFFSRFQRLIELVGSDTEDKARSRERFRFYRDRGYDLHTHNL